MLKERKRNRLFGYDYSKDNLYFVTSCVQDRICCFGEIINGNMILNDAGNIVFDQWYWLEKQYPYVVLHAFVVMPNHIHGIIEIIRNRIDGDFRENVGTGRDPSLHFRENPGIKIKSLSELMGAYKTTSSKQIHLLGNGNVDGDGIDQCRERSRPFPTLINSIKNVNFRWQRSFHDHIIRNDRSFERISEYIKNNPTKWNADRFNY